MHQAFSPTDPEEMWRISIPLCLHQVASLKSTYITLLLVQQCAGHILKYMEACFSLLGVYSLSDEIRHVRLLSCPGIVSSAVAALTSEGQGMSSLP